MLSERELEASIKATESSIKYHRQTAVSSVLNLRAMRRDLQNYKTHLAFLKSKQMSLGEVANATN